jgi:hypothetical protein
VAIHGVVDPNPAISSAARSLIAKRSTGQREATKLKEELSAFLGCALVTLNAKLRGDRLWDAYEVKKLAIFFGKPTDYFYDDQERFLAPDPRRGVSEQAGRRDDQLPLVADGRHATTVISTQSPLYPVAA